MSEVKAPVVDPDPPERPSVFEPFERWKAAWKPPENYIDLREVKKICEDHGFALTDVLPNCQCLGFTMHKEVELPQSAWSDSQWVWDVDDNRCGQPRYGDHLQFQVAVYRGDVLEAVGEKTEETIDEDQTEVELKISINKTPAMPLHWELHTVGDVVFQAVGKVNTDDPSTRLYGPMRIDKAMAVADAWSYHHQGVWV